jgi:cell division protein FtsQ
VSAAPANRKRAVPQAPILEAPFDAIVDDSPLPSAATTTVRPPPKTWLPKLGRVGRTLQLVAGVAVVLSASVAVAWGARRYVMQSPRFGVRTILVDGNHKRAAETVA